MPIDMQTKKKPLERHHLFPRAFLEASGINDLRHINQMANFALLEWPDNISISDDAPSSYVPKILARFGVDAAQQMMQDHALPEGWETLAYDEFLIARRSMMATVIQKGFGALL